MNAAIKKARAQLYRQVILEAAERVFAERGFGGARMQHIAEAAEVSVGTIYGVFGSKAELYGVTMSERLAEVTAMASAAATAGSSPLDRLDRGVQAYVQYMLDHPDFLRIHLNNHAWGLGPNRGSAVRVGGWRAGLDLLAGMIEVAIGEGDVIPGDPVLMARSLVAVQQVHLARWIEEGRTMPAADVAERLRTTFRLMFCTHRSPQ